MKWLTYIWTSIIKKNCLGVVNFYIIIYFKNNDSESFKNALYKIDQSEQLDKSLLNEVTLDSRIKKIIQFINS